MYALGDQMQPKYTTALDLAVARQRQECITPLGIVQPYTARRTPPLPASLCFAPIAHHAGGTEACRGGGERGVRVLCWIV